MKIADERQKWNGRTVKVWPAKAEVTSMETLVNDSRLRQIGKNYGEKKKLSEKSKMNGDW